MKNHVALFSLFLIITFLSGCSTVHPELQESKKSQETDLLDHAERTITSTENLDEKSKALDASNPSHKSILSDLNSTRQKTYDISERLLNQVASSKKQLTSKEQQRLQFLKSKLQEVEAVHEINPNYVKMYHSLYGFQQASNTIQRKKASNSHAHRSPSVKNIINKTNASRTTNSKPNLTKSEVTNLLDREEKLIVLFEKSYEKSKALDVSIPLHNTLLISSAPSKRKSISSSKRRLNQLSSRQNQLTASQHQRLQLLKNRLNKIEVIDGNPKLPQKKISSGVGADLVIVENIINSIEKIDSSIDKLDASIPSHKSVLVKSKKIRKQIGRSANDTLNRVSSRKKPLTAMEMKRFRLLRNKLSNLGF